MSHIKQIQARNKAYKRIVLRLTGLTEDQYHDLQLDLARRYLEYMLGDDPMGIDYVYHSSQFWSWYLNRWNQADYREIVPALYSLEKEIRAERYQLMHFTLQLVSVRKPTIPQHVMNDLYLRRQGLNPDMVQLKPQAQPCK